MSKVETEIDDQTGELLAANIDLQMQVQTMEEAALDIDCMIARQNLIIERISASHDDLMKRLVKAERVNEKLAIENMEMKKQLLQDQDHEFSPESNGNGHNDSVIQHKRKKQ